MPTTLLDRAAGRRAAAAPTTTHPLAQVRQAAVDVAQRAGRRSCRGRICRVCIFSPACSRAAAARMPNGQLDGGFSGLGLDRANWAAGVQVVFPERVRLHEPARAQGRGGGIGARRDGAATTRRC